MCMGNRSRFPQAPSGKGASTKDNVIRSCLGCVYETVSIPKAYTVGMPIIAGANTAPLCPAVSVREPLPHMIEISRALFCGGPLQSAQMRIMMDHAGIEAP